MRPKGLVYIILTAFMYVYLSLLTGLFISGVILFIPRMFLNVIEFFRFISCVVASIVFAIIIVLQTCEVIRYRIVFGEDHLFIAANRDLGLVRHKDLIFKYEGITSLQYMKMLRPDLYHEGMFYFSAIYITRKGDEEKKRKKDEYILTMWFSKKQAHEIMREISEKAKIINGYDVEILPDRYPVIKIKPRKKKRKKSKKKSVAKSKTKEKTNVKDSNKS